MSWHFDLLDQIDGNVPFSNRRQLDVGAAETATATSGTIADGWSADEAMGLVHRIFFQHAGVTPKVAVFAGIGRDEECSHIALSVAETLAKIGHGPVCLVEANLRSPTLASLLGKTEHFGFTDSLLREDPIRSFVLPLRTEALWLLSSGTISPGAPKLLSSERARRRMAELRREFSYVILHAPPLSDSADALSIASATDGLVLVLEAGSTRREAAQTAVSSLRSAKIPILGAVLNNRKFPIPERIYKWL